MRVALVLMVFLLQSRMGFSQTQTISLSEKKATLEDIIEKIQSQTAYNFLVDAKTLATAKPVDINVKDATLEQVLQICFKDQPLKYTISGNTIVVKPLEKSEAKLPEPKTSGLHYVEGRVVDNKGGAIPGVNILIRGTSEGTVTDAEGKYSLQVNEGDLLLFSFIGFKRFETEAGERTVIDVTLEEEAATLSEVVVNAGYYEVKERESTGSIAKVGADIISKQPVTNPMGTLQGRMAGVYVQQTTGVPGGDFKIQIRGKNSLRDDGNEPFYIVDGVPFSSEKVSSANDNTIGIINGGVSPLTSINPADIESIEVLKDADATAIYGSRGANGVVLITTKKGKAGKTKFDLNFFTGAGRVQRKQLLNTPQYLAMRHEAFRNDKLIPSASKSDNTGANGRGYAPDLMVWDTTRYTDWQKLLTGGTAMTTSIQPSLSGGNEQTQFLISAGYLRQTSPFIGDSRYQKLSSHVSVNHRSVNRKFNIGVSLSGSSDSNNQPQEDPTYSARGLAPNAPAVYDPSGNLNWENSTWWNPLAYLQRQYNGSVFSLVGNLTVRYEIKSGVRVQVRAGLNRLDSREMSLLPSTWFDPALGYGAERSSVNTSSGLTNSWSVEPQMNWDKKISDGQLGLLIGGTFQSQYHDLLAYSYANFPSNALLHDVSAAAIRTILNYSTSEYKYAALSSRINYNWKGKYIINLTGRRDGSSRFGPGNKFANFGAVGAAWIFSEESFLKGNSIISFGKLRGSYGVSGNDQIGNYQYLDTYAPTAGIRTQYLGITGLDPSRLYNANFGWETNRKIEGVIELGLLEDRIYLTAGYYHNRSSNQLVNYTLPKTTGFGGILSNLPATVQNTGIELSLSTTNFNARGFKWTSTFNMTVPRNKLIEFPNLDSSSYANTYVIGQSIYIQKLYNFTGISTETGLPMMKDYNNDGVISTPADNKIAVFVGQDFFGGLGNTITYKGWTLDFFFQYVKQTGPRYSFIPGYINLNHPAFILDQNRWHTPGDQAEFSRYVTEYNKEVMGASISTSVFEKYNQSTALIMDASFVRLKTAMLSYQISAKWLGSVSCKAYVQGQNLFVISPYQGFDPETLSTTLPPLRTITLGLNLSF